MSDLSFFIMQIYKISTISRKSLNANICCESGTEIYIYFLWENFYLFCDSSLLGGKFGEFGKFETIFFLPMLHALCFTLHKIYCTIEEFYRW